LEQRGDAPVAQGVEQWFPNPKIYVASARNGEEILSFTGFGCVITQRYCEKVEQDWSKSMEQSLLLPAPELP